MSLSPLGSWILDTLWDFNAAMTPEEELFEERYNSWIYYLWSDFVSPQESWYPLWPQYGNGTWEK